MGQLRQHSLALGSRGASGSNCLQSGALASKEARPQPTEEPTEVPTEEPTAIPTAEPTEKPTDEPTEQPTLPTVAPTAQPTDVQVGGEIYLPVAKRKN